MRLDGRVRRSGAEVEGVGGDEAVIGALDLPGNVHRGRSWSGTLVERQCIWTELPCLDQDSEMGGHR